jgi:hypothetical protein
MFLFRLLDLFVERQVVRHERILHGDQHLVQLLQNGELQSLIPRLTPLRRLRRIKDIKLSIPGGLSRGGVQGTHRVVSLAMKHVHRGSGFATLRAARPGLASVLEAEEGHRSIITTDIRAELGRLRGSLPPRVE